MMWSTKLIGLVALLGGSVLCYAGELARQESNIRADAEQEPFETLTMPDAGGPTSKLFGDCLALSSEINAKLYSIEVPGTLVEYVRHVPDSYELRVPVEWKSLTMVPPVSNILQCSSAASNGGYQMFKYNGGAICSVSNRIYDLTYSAICETAEQEAAFVSTNASSKCPLPAMMLDIDTSSGNCTCLSVTASLMTFTEAKAWCAARNAIVFEETPRTNYSKIVQLLNGLNESPSNFFTGATIRPDGNWVWKNTSILVDTSLMSGVSENSTDTVMYMKGSNAFKFHFAQNSTFKARAMCLAENSPL